MIRARSFWFFSNVNPTLEFSGFEGENKKEMYEQLPEKYYPKTLFVSTAHDLGQLKRSLASNGFTYPFVVKPQVGMHAMLFRKIQSEEQLECYHQKVKVDYMIQDFIDLPMEFSVFHIRYPGESKGRVTGFIRKDYLSVTGNGKSTLIDLIRQHPKARYREQEMRYKHARCLDVVIPKGEKYYLSIAGNHNRGARFINLRDEIDESLSAVFDRISNEAGHFYFGRYDLKCTSVEDLKRGKNFAILEYNGAGAEPNHIYDCGMRYMQALRIIAEHWDHLYKISSINYRKGVPYWTFTEGYRYLRKAKTFFKKMRQADLDLQFMA